MSALPTTTLTVAEYLAIERAAETKSERYDRVKKFDLYRVLPSLQE
jgi:hypothetical protein